MTTASAENLRFPQNANLRKLTGKLIAASERSPIPPFHRIDFPAHLDASRAVMPMQFLSLHDHPVFASMDSESRWRLGLLETINFFSLNIHGEQALVAELAERLYRDRTYGESEGTSQYLQHFIHEENSHTYMLAEFCNRYYGKVMPEVVYRFENPCLSRSGKDLLFYGRVYVLETLLDFVNCAAMRDETLEPTARAVHRSHHLDETRHIAFDRAMIASLTKSTMDEGRGEELRTVGTLVRSYMDYAFSRLANPRVYRELGLENPLTLLRDVQMSVRWRTLKGQWQKGVDRFLTQVALFEQPLPLPGDSSAGTAIE